MFKKIIIVLNSFKKSLKLLLLGPSRAWACNGLSLEIIEPGHQDPAYADLWLATYFQK